MNVLSILGFTLRIGMKDDLARNLTAFMHMNDMHMHVVAQKKMALL